MLCLATFSVCVLHTALCRLEPWCKDETLQESGCSQTDQLRTLYTFLLYPQ